MKLKPTNGFTIVELLLALTLFSVLSVSVYFNFQVGMLLYSRIGKQIGYVNDYRLCFDKMEIELHNIVPYDEVSFEGKSKSVSFPAFVEEYTKGERRETLLQITYEFKNKRLYRKVKNLKTKGMSFDKKLHKDVLLDDILLGSFDYLYVTPSGDMTWRDEWDVESETAMPYAFRFTFKPKSSENAEALGIKYDTITKTFMLPLGSLVEVKLND